MKNKDNNIKSKFRDYIEILEAERIYMLGSFIAPVFSYLVLFNLPIWNTIPRQAFFIFIFISIIIGLFCLIRILFCLISKEKPRKTIIGVIIVLIPYLLILVAVFYTTHTAYLYSAKMDLKLHGGCDKNNHIYNEIGICTKCDYKFELAIIEIDNTQTIPSRHDSKVKGIGCYSEPYMASKRIWVLPNHAVQINVIAYVENAFGNIWYLTDFDCWIHVDSLLGLDVHKQTK